MTLNEFNYITSIGWGKKYQPLTIDMTKDKYRCRYWTGLKDLFIQNSSPF